MLGGNLGSLLDGDVSVMIGFAYKERLGHQPITEETVDIFTRLCGCLGCSESLLGMLYHIFDFSSFDTVFFTRTLFLSLRSASRLV